MSDKPPANPDDSQLGYEVPDEHRPSSAIPTEQELEKEAPTFHALDYSPPPPAHDPYAALRHRDFVIFVCGWFIGALGTQIQSAGIAWEIYDRTHSKMLLGWVAGVQVIPLFLLALPAGKIADTFDRRRIISLSMLGALLCSIALAWLSYRPGGIPWMFVIISLNSACLVLGRPSRSSMLPLVVPRHLFANGVTWNTSAFQISSMAGPTIGGFLVALSLAFMGSVSICYVIDAISAAIFGTLILLVRMRPPDRAQQHAVDRSILAGFHFVWRNKVLLGTMTLDLFAVLLGGVAYLLPVFAKDILHVGPRGFGCLKGAESIGAFIMTMIIAHLPPMKRAGHMLVAVLGFGCATIVFAISTNFWLSFAMLVFLGVFDSISVVVRHTLVQVLTPDSMRGRVSAVNNISIGASNELGGLESGLTAALFGTVLAVIIGGVGTIATVAGIAMLFPQIRRFGSLHDARPAEDSPPDPRRGFEPVLKQSTPS